MLTILGKITGSLLGAALGRMGAERKVKSDVIAGQQRANEAEINGAPASRLRLWRSFLGWVLSLVFAWEVVGRGLVATYWPHVRLPPSVLEDIGAVLLGMLGLGF